MDKKTNNKLQKWDLGNVLDYTGNEDLVFYKDLAQRNLEDNKNRVLTYSHKAYFNIYEFGKDLKIEAIHRVHSNVEYEPKSIKFYNGKIYILLERQLIVMSFPENNFSSTKVKKIAYKTTSIYSDFAINHDGVFLFLKQISSNETDGCHLVATKTPDVEGTGEVTVHDKRRMLEESNLRYTNSEIIYKASFQYTGYSIFLLKHLSSKFGSQVLSYLDFDARDLKSAGTYYSTPQASSNYKKTEYFQTKRFLYYINDQSLASNKDVTITEKVGVLHKSHQNQLGSKLIQNSQALTGKIISVIAGYNSPLSNHHLIMANPPKNTSKYFIPAQYDLNLYTEHFSKSGIEFKPLEGSKSTGASQFQIRIKTSEQEYLVNACFGMKCTLKDSRTVINQKEKGTPSGNNHFIEFFVGFGIIGIFIFVIKWIASGHDRQVKQTQDLMNSIISEDDMDSKSKQKERLRKEIELQNQTDMSLSEIKMMQDSMDQSRDMKNTEEQDLDLDMSQEIAGF